MKNRSTITVAELHLQTPKIMRQTQRRGMLAVTREGQITAFLVSRDRLMAMIETMELLANPEAMNAVHEFESGKGKFYTVEELDVEMKA